MAFITLVFRPLFRFVHDRQRNRTNSCMNFIIDAIKKVHFIKAFSLEERMLRNFEQEQFKLSKSDFYANITKNIPADMQSMIGQLTILGCLVVGAPEVIERSMTVGILVTSMLLSSRAIQAFQSLGSHWIKYGEIEVAKKKVNNLLSIKTIESKEIPESVELSGHLQVHGLCYSYGLSEEDSFLGLNLDIKAKEMVGLTGTNFILLSVLAEMMCGLRKPPIGSIMLDGHNLEFLDREDLKGVVEYVPLNATLIPGTILDNIARFNPEHRLTAQQLAENLGLSEWASRLPKGLYTMIDRKSRATLASSFVQLISLARALVVNPKVLIIDHIELGLDDIGRRKCHDIIKQLARQITIIIISDNSGILREMDKVYQFGDNDVHCTLNKNPRD